MIRYDVVKSWKFDDVRFHYGDKEVILYNLAVGLGDLSPSERLLNFTYERDLQVLPTFLATVGAPGAWWRDPRTGADGARLVQGEQHLEIYGPIPSQGRLIAKNHVHSLTDKGPGKGAIGVVIREIFDEASGDRLASSTNVSVLRADGGFSAESGVSDPPPPRLPEVPDTRPDFEICRNTKLEAPLLYRLTGDMNPIHFDPDTAREAGFRAPIMHGLCSLALACRALIGQFADFDPSKLRKIATRFTAPVYPGETLKISMWKTADPNTIQWRASELAKGHIVMDCGIAAFKDH